MINLTQVLTAIQDRLEGDSGIIGVVSTDNMGNFLPQNSSYPHIFYQVKGEPLDAKNETSLSIELQFDVWSSKTGSAESLNILNLIENAFDGIPLTIASGVGFGSTLLSFDAQLEPDGKIYRGLAVYELLFGDI